MWQTSEITQTLVRKMSQTCEKSNKLVKNVTNWQKKSQTSKKKHKLVKKARN